MRLIQRSLWNSFWNFSGNFFCDFSSISTRSFIGSSLLGLKFLPNYFQEFLLLFTCEFFTTLFRKLFPGVPCAVLLRFIFELPTYLREFSRSSFRKTLPGFFPNVLRSFRNSFESSIEHFLLGVSENTLSEVIFFLIKVQYFQNEYLEII